MCPRNARGEIIDNGAAETRRVRLRQRVPETTDVIMRRAAQPSRGSGQQPSSTLEHAAVNRDRWRLLAATDTEHASR